MGPGTAIPLTNPLRANGSPITKLIGLSVMMIAPMVVPVSPSEAQKLYSIGSLSTGDSFINVFEGFRARMTELGYRERQNVRYQYYNSKGIGELLGTIAHKLVYEKVDLIVTSSTTATVAAAQAPQGTPIPVVFLSAGNSQKIFKSFSGSGTNLAGIGSASLELTGKRFELLKELPPRTKRIAVPLDPNGVNYKAMSRRSKRRRQSSALPIRKSMCTGSRR